MVLNHDQTTCDVQEEISGCKRIDKGVRYCENATETKNDPKRGSILKPLCLPPSYAKKDKKDNKGCYSNDKINGSKTCNAAHKCINLKIT